MAIFYTCLKRLTPALFIICTTIFQSLAQTTVFTDDFNRASVSPGGTPSMTYTNTIATGAVISTNSSTHLRIASGTVNGVSYVSAPTATFGSPYTTTLSSNTGVVTWAFNFRWNRAAGNNPAAPASGAFGQAIVLAASGANFTSGTTGYAIVYGNSSTPDPIRLVRFSGGVTGTLTDIISSGASDIASTNNFVSVRVTYNPASNTWALFIRDDGASAWADPSTGVTTQKGSNTVNNTYTGTALSHFGFLWSHATTTTHTGDFDNFSVTVTPSTGAPTLTTPTATSITESSALLGATVTADGGSTITDRGTSYKTSSPVAATDNAATEGGTNVAAFTHTRSSLQPQTLYYYTGYAINANGTGQSSEGSFRTLSNPPAGQAASVSTTNYTQSTIDLTIGTPAAFPSSGATRAGYAVIYATGTPTLGSANGQAPAAGTGTLFTTSTSILPATPANSIQVTGLTAVTSYNFLVVPYTWDGTNAATYHYYTPGAPTASGSTTTASEPTVQATFTSIASLNTNSLTINFTAGTGGSGRIVVLRQGSAVDFVPADGSTYTANTNFSSGTGVGPASDNKVVYNNSGTSVAVTGLTANTLYHLAIYEYNGTGTARNYLNASPAASSFTTLNTLATEPTSNAGVPSISNVSTSSFDLNWTAGSGVAGYLVVRRQGGTPEVPSDGVAYAANDPLGSNSTVVYSGSNLTVAQSSLPAATSYQYRIYSYNGSGNTTNYRTSSFASGTFYTLSAEPAAHAASFTATVNSATSVTLNFSAAVTTPASGYILLRKTTAFSGSDLPDDGKGYVNNDVLGGATVLITITNSATTTYHTTVTADGHFYYLLVPFNWDGSNTGTRNYYTGGSPASAQAVTPSGASDVVAIASSESATIASTLNTATIAASTDGAQVWQFTLRDGGATSDADNLPTKVTAINIGQASGNQINDFSEAIQSVNLFDGTIPVTASIAVTATQIQFTNMSLSIPDNGSVTLTMRLSVKTNVNGGASTGQNADGDDFRFQIGTAAASGIVVDVPANSSQLSGYAAVLSANSQNVYAVTATSLRFVQQPGSTATYTAISPAVTIEGTDAGGNRDLDLTASVNMTATGAALGTSPNTSMAASGLATFSAIEFTSTGTGVTLTAQSAGLDSATSTAFDVTLGAGSYQYRTIRSGDWKDTTSGNEVWERSTDGTSWHTITSSTDIPSASAGPITITNGHAVTVSSAVSADQLTIEAGAQLTVNASQSFTVANGTGTDLQVNGILQNNGGTFTLTGTTAFGTGSTLKVASGAGSDILTTNVTYDAASTIEITGVVGQTSYTFPSKQIGNLVWNNSGQTGNLNTSGTIGNLVIKGNLIVRNTGSASLRLTGTANLALVIDGSFGIESTASLDVDNNSAGTSTISVGGDFHLSGGTLQSSIDQVEITLTGTGKTFAQSGTFTNNNLNWVIAEDASVTLGSDWPLAGSRSLVVNGTLACATYTVSGAGAFNLTATGTLNVGSPEGLAAGSASGGNITVSGTRTYNAAASFIYSNPGSAQVTGNNLPVTIANLTVNNFNGVTLTNTTTQTGTLTLKAGQFDAAGQLTLDAAGSLVFNGGSIINFTMPALLNHFTPGTGIVFLPADLEVNGTLDLGSGIFDIGTHHLKLNGTLARSTGTIRASGASITLSGSAPSDTLFFDQSARDTTNSLAALTINRNAGIVALGNQVYLTGTVSPLAGTLQADSNLVLASTLAGSARIAELGAGADVAGDVIVQRYLIGGSVTQRGWRTMSSPVQHSTCAQLKDDIFITGPGGIANGFDASGSNSSVRYYEESASRGWKSISSVHDTLDAGKGLLVFFRGDRTQPNSLTNTSVVPNDVTADFTGTINKGSINVPLDFEDTGIPADDGFNFVGNPYPCEIVWDQITLSANVDVSFWILNPNTGNYVSQTGNTQIASGQGFLVQVNASGQNITFEEGNKGNGNPTAYFKTSAQPFTVKMHEDATRYDVAWLSFAQGASKNYVFKEDARKLSNPVYNLSFVTPDSQLVQRNVSGISNQYSDTFVMQVTSTANAAYTLVFEELGIIPASKDIYLVDLYLNTTVNVRTTPQYTFQIHSANAGSSGNRFLLVFSGAGSLPVKILSFTGTGHAKENILLLEVAQEKNIRSYALLKSADGETYEHAATVKAADKLNNTTYTITDPQPFATTFYKVQVNEMEGTSFYSRTISINRMPDARPGPELFPNPAAGELFLKGLEGSALRLHTPEGQLIATYPAGTPSIDVSGLAKGLYILECISETQTQTLKFIKH